MTRIGAQSFVRQMIAIVLWAAVSAPNSYAQAKPQTAAKTKQKIKQLKTGLSKIQDKKDVVGIKLKSKTAEVKLAKVDLVAIDARIGSIKRRIASTLQTLTSAEARQMRINEEFRLSSIALAKVTLEVRVRLKRMYVTQNGTTLSVLLDSNSSGDLASRQYLLEQIAKKDRAVYSEYLRYRKYVTEKRAEINMNFKVVKALARQQRDEQAELAQAREEKALALRQLQAERDQLLKQFAQFERDEREIEAQIQAALQREISTSKGGALPPRAPGKFGRPTSGGQTSGFGNRFHPILKRSRLHAGVDFGGGHGASVFATASGVVTSTSRLGGYGNTIIISHGGGISSVYAHLSSIGVRSGQSVRMGQRIGAIGSTGLSTGPHLHFEIRIGGKAVNPNRYL